MLEKNRYTEALEALVSFIESSVRFRLKMLKMEACAGVRRAKKFTGTADISAVFEVVSNMKEYAQTGRLFGLESDAGKSILSRKDCAIVDQWKQRTWSHTGGSFRFGRWDKARWWLISPGRMEFWFWIACFLLLVVTTGAILVMALWNVGWLPVVH